jgi:hypothetical protein
LVSLSGGLLGRPGARAGSTDRDHRCAGATCCSSSSTWQATKAPFPSPPPARPCGLSWGQNRAQKFGSIQIDLSVLLSERSHAERAQRGAIESGFPFLFFAPPAAGHRALARGAGRRSRRALSPRLVAPQRSIFQTLSQPASMSTSSAAGDRLALSVSQLLFFPSQLTVTPPRRPPLPAPSPELPKKRPNDQTIQASPTPWAPSSSRTRQSP